MWCEGLRVAIPKGDGDVRPITIEPVFGKIFEMIMAQRLTFINESFNKHDQYNRGDSRVASGEFVASYSKPVASYRSPVYSVN